MNKNTKSKTQTTQKNSEFDEFIKPVINEALRIANDSLLSNLKINESLEILEDSIKRKELSNKKIRTIKIASATNLTINL